MSKKLESLKFNLTIEMSKDILEYEKLRKKLDNLYDKYNVTKDEKELINIIELEKNLNIIKNNFIKEFRLSNKKQIEEYKKIKEDL